MSGSATHPTHGAPTTDEPRRWPPGPWLLTLAVAAPWLTGAALSAAVPGAEEALVRKEGPVEHLTHLLLLCAVVAHARHALARGGRLRHLLPAAICLLFLLEEIDYGQLYLGFATPDWLRPLTGRSDHLNFHNTTAADVLLPMFYGGYLIVLPLVAHWHRWKRISQRNGLAPLAAGVGLLFFGAALLSYVLERVGYTGYDPTEMLDLTAATVLLAAGLAPRLLFRGSSLP